MRGVTSEREVWLQLACLAVSVGLHAAMTVVFWQRPASLPGPDELVTVTLVDRPAGKPAGSPSPEAGARPKSRPPAPLRREPAPSPPAATVSPVVTVPPAEVPPVTFEKPAEESSAQVFPAATVAATSPPGNDRDGQVAPAEAGSGSGTTAGAGGPGKAGRRAASGDGEETAGLIKATPRYESNPLPPYPRVARQNRWQGTVRLRARVSAAGEIEKVSLERSSGHEVLDHAALQGVRPWRFIPATRNGVPVACEVSIPVAFRLTE